MFGAIEGGGRVLGRLKEWVKRGWLGAGMWDYNAWFPVEPIEFPPCLVLRHDLDDLDSHDIERLMKFEQGLGVRSTCFALRYQLTTAADALRALLEGGWDVQCHSQGRTFIGEIDDCRWLEHRYRRRLSRSLTRWRALGWPVDGHAPHGIHNYLAADPDSNCDIIEAATIGSGFAWISGYRAIVKTAHGQEFPLPTHSYVRRDPRTGQRVVVFPTAWDDRYFLRSREDGLMARPARTVDEARRSVLRQLAVCEAAGAPLVISLHPVLWLAGDRASYDADFVTWVVDTCSARNLPVTTLSALAARAADVAA